MRTGPNTSRGCIHEKWTLGRTAISKALCRQWD